MLSALLTNLQSLISARFIVPSVFPVLAFWVLNGAMLFWLNAPFREVAARTIDQERVGQSAFLFGAGLFGVLLSAYMFSAIVPAIQSILEGRWPAWLVRLFVGWHVRQIDAARIDIDAVIRVRSGLEEPLFSGKSRAEDWKDRLAAARAVGASRNVNAFGSESAGAMAIAALEKRRRRHDLIDAPLLGEAVRLLAIDLLDNNANLPGPTGKFTLDAAHGRLQTIVDEAVRYAQHEHIRLTNRLHFGFGAQRAAPTLMGNVANTVQSYAEERYNLNLEVFWSSMQRAIRRDKDSFATIMQDAKTQLDFLTACVFLTALWSIVWLVGVIVVNAGRAALLVAAAGPLIAYLWYRVAVVHYRTFADVLRSSVDLFRFDLLTDLHVALPEDVSHERELWDTLHRMTCYYEAVNVRFKHPKTS